MKAISNHLYFLLIVILAASCENNTGSNGDTNQIGVERLSSKIDEIIPKDAEIEVLAEGFTWSEGPLWLPQQEILLFSDVPMNTIYKWSEKGGSEIYLKPSGYTGPPKEGKQEGANGLLLNGDGELVLCQHGDRRIALMNASLDDPKPDFETRIDHYLGDRFNSPNDGVFDSRGILYFTDPPYGLDNLDADTAKDLKFNGVYRLTPGGKLTLLYDKLTKPNGIALSPDETKLYVSNSDPEKCLWMVFDLRPDGTLENEKVFFDATELYNGKNGLADGMKVDDKGNIFATGPGGVLIFSPEGKHLGTIKTGQATANCAFNADQSVLYMTAHMYLMRIDLKK